MKITFTKKNAYKNNSYETLEFIKTSVKVINFLYVFETFFIFKTAQGSLRIKFDYQKIIKNKPLKILYSAVSSSDFFIVRHCTCNLM